MPLADMPVLEPATSVDSGRPELIVTDDRPGDRLLQLLATVAAARLGPEQIDEPSRTVTMEQVVADDRALLQGEHKRLVERSVPPQVAASYLVGWYAASLAEVVGIGLAGTGAGFAVTPSSVRWRVHADGWIMGAHADVHALVTPAHPWAARDDVTVLATTHDVLAATVATLVDVVRPIVDACHGLAKIGRVGLWNEVGDALGMVLAHQSVIETSDDRVALLEAAVRVTGAPWRARPRLWFVDTATVGRLHVAQKGGCCLAYKEPAGDDAENVDVLDDHHREHLARFPVVPGQPVYCSTCSFRDPQDCADRQVFWSEHHAPS